MLQHLTDYLPYFLLFLFVFVGLIFFIVVYFSGISLKEQFESLGLGSSPFFKKIRSLKQEPNIIFETLKNGFFYALDFLKLRPLGPFYDSIRAAKEALSLHLEGRDYLYKLPWFMVIGDSGSGKSSMLSHTEMPNPLLSPNFGRPVKNPLIEWWFFEKGIVIEPTGATLNDDASTSSKARWTTLLKALKHFRPKRALDGLILTVPASYFSGPDALTDKQISTKGRELSEQLVQTESLFGLKLPIYVIITKCDVLGGCKGFCQELPPHSLSEIFGWSNPYTTDTAYTSDWVKESFLSIQSFILEAILRIFSKREVKVYQDDLMVFTNNFSKISSGLTLYLDEIFQKHDYKEHFMLRGIYGTCHVPENNDVTKIYQPFLKDLFEKKILIEGGLAAPLQRFVFSLNHTFNRLRLAILGLFVTGCFGMYWVEKNVSQVVKVLNPIMNQTFYVVKELSPKEIQNPNNMSKVLDFILVTGQNKFYTPSIVTFSSVSLEKVASHLYKIFVANELVNGLDVKAVALMVTPPDFPSASKTNGVFNPTETPEFLLLEGYVNALLDLQKMADAYNVLGPTKNISNFEQLISYLYNGYDIQKFKSPEAMDFLQTLISSQEYKPFNLGKYSLFAEKRLYELYNNFLKRILDPEYNADLVYKLQKTLKQVEGTGIPDLKSFRNSLMEIKEVLSFITNSGSWLTKPVFDPGSRYQKLMDNIKEIPFFTENVQKKISETSEKLYQKATTYLQSYGSPLTGYFLTWSKTINKLEPSDGLLKLEKGINVFLNQPFMQQVDGNPFVDQIPNDQFLYWDPKNLRNALALAENYRNFIEEQISSYPINLQDTLRVVGREQLQQNIEVMLERSQSFYELPSKTWGTQVDNASQVQANNLTETTPLFTKLLKSLDNLGAHTTYKRLKSLLLNQYYKSLSALDDTLNQSDFYTPIGVDFSTWDGKKNGILKAYNLSDVDEMSSYFANQSSRIISMALQHATPIITFLKSDSFNLSIDQIKIITRWATILDQAEAYSKGKGKAAGTMKILEQFLEKDGNQITYDTCMTDLDPAVMNAPTSDYFIGKRNDLMQSMYKRCQKLMAEKGIIQYKKISEYFNAFLANSFPFVSVVSRDPSSDSDVSYDMLDAFFKELNLLTPEIEGSVHNFYQNDPSWKQARLFLSQMRLVRNFFQTYLTPLKKDGTPGLTFMLKFNENKLKSVLTEQVADWAFIAGDKAFNLKEQGNNLRIRYDMNSTISFGFEFNPMFPLFSAKTPSSPALVALGKRSLYVYEGSWALLRAMMIHLTPVKEGGNSSNDTLLGFTVPLSAGPDTPITTNAKLFVQIIPIATSGIPAISFKIPQFPTKAPSLKINNIP